MGNGDKLQRMIKKRRKKRKEGGEEGRVGNEVERKSGGKMKETGTEGREMLTYSEPLQNSQVGCRVLLFALR